MKKISLFLLISLVALSVRSYSQTTSSAPSTAATSDLFAGKWEILVTGLPDGDSKFVTDLVRKEGKLTGELVTRDPSKPKIPITKVEEVPSKQIIIYFNTEQAGEIAIDLTKVDNDHLKGQLMSMFDATAQRVKK